MSSPIFYIDGQFVSQENASVSVLDLSVLRGFAVFDYLRTYKGKPFHLDEHLERLRYSAEQLGLNLPEDLPSCKQKILETLEKNNFAESSIKILITAGTSPDQLIPTSQSKLLILVYPLTSPSQQDYTQGIATVTTHLPRSCPKSKTTHYVPGLLSLKKHPHAKEALHLNSRGQILEGSTSNFFAFKNGTLYTTDSDDILLGITREVVCNISPYPLSKTPIHYDEIDSIDEAFITSSSREIMPVTSIDGKPIGKGVPGALTQHLMQLFFAYTELTSWPTLLIERHQTPENHTLTSNHA
ncbi:MAG: hypothetical protein RLZZ453_1266 [Chlamydiota bacterium]|jgi:branched-chain amino acid aminotransferase